MYIAYSTRVRPHKQKPFGLSEILSKPILDGLQRYRVVHNLPESYINLLEHSANRLEQILWTQTFYDGARKIPHIKIVVSDVGGVCQTTPYQFCPEDGKWYEFGSHIFSHAPHATAKPVSSVKWGTVRSLLPTLQDLDCRCVIIASQKDFTLADYSLLDLAWYARRFVLPPSSRFILENGLHYCINRNIHHTW